MINYLKVKINLSNSTLFVFVSLIPNSLAKQFLTKPLVVASKEAQSPYLKTESFRILGTLYKVKEDKDDLKKILKESSTLLCQSLFQALTDTELSKAKRVRDILKVIENLVEFSNVSGNTSMWSEASKLVEPLEKLSESSVSNPIKAQCQKIEKQIRDGVEKNKSASHDVEKKATNTVGSAKKDKKKKKKGKNKK